MYGAYPDQYKKHTTDAQRKKLQALLKRWGDLRGYGVRFTTNVYSSYVGNIYIGSRLVAMGISKIRDGQFDPYLIDQKKIDTMLVQTRHAHVQLILVVRFLTGGSADERWMNVTRRFRICTPETTPMHNNSRKEFDDMCYKLPLQWFTKLVRKD